MIFYYLFEYIAVVILMLIFFVIFKAIIRQPVSADSIKILLNGSFISFLISIAYTAVIMGIDRLYGNNTSSSIVMMLLLILNLSFYICFTVIYYNRKTGAVGE